MAPRWRRPDLADGAKWIRRALEGFKERFVRIVADLDWAATRRTIRRRSPPCQPFMPGPAGVGNNASVRCWGRRSAASWMIIAVGLVPGGCLPRWLPGARTAS